MRCIVEGSSFDIPVQEMKDGDLGEITAWGPYTERRGQVVQRVENMLLSVGQPVGRSWSDILQSPDSDCRVRLLEVGETIKLVK